MYDNHIFGIGEKRWNRVLKQRTFDKNCREYMRTHGGDLPPEPIVDKIIRIVFREPNPYKIFLEYESDSTQVNKLEKKVPSRKQLVEESH